MRTKIVISIFIGFLLLSLCVILVIYYLSQPVFASKSKPPDFLSSYKKTMYESKISLAYNVRIGSACFGNRETEKSSKCILVFQRVVPNDGISENPVLKFLKSTSFIVKENKDISKWINDLEKIKNNFYLSEITINNRRYIFVSDDGESNIWWIELGRTEVPKSPETHHSQKPL